MNIKWLEDLVCLAKVENFTLAARERHITQSALSRRIKALEQWLGTDMVDRESKHFNLTAQGRIFVLEAEVILRRLYNARQTACVLGEDSTYEITVAAQNSIAQTLFLDWAKRIEARLDKVYVRLLSEKLSECISLLEQGHVNYLFCYANETMTPPIDEKRFACTVIGKDSLIPVCAANSKGVAQFCLPGSFDAPLPFVAYSHDSIFGKAVNQLIQPESHRCFLTRRYENPYSHTLKSLVTENLGLAWLPKTSITADLEEGSLCRAGDEHWDIDFDIRLYHHHSARSAQDSAVLETSLKMAQELSN